MGIDGGSGMPTTMELMQEYVRKYKQLEAKTRMLEEYKTIIGIAATEAEYEAVRTELADRLAEDGTDKFECDGVKARLKMPNQMIGDKSETAITKLRAVVGDTIYYDFVRIVPEVPEHTEPLGMTEIKAAIKRHRLSEATMQEIMAALGVHTKSAPTLVVA